LLAGCTQQEAIGKNTKPVVYVVGDGVPPQEQTAAAERPYPLNRAQGYAMWRGVKSAFDRSPRLDRVRGMVELVGIDDLGNTDRAKKAAAKIRDDARTIAVIGHATSATTRAALPDYAAASIPLLMPIATSPEIFNRDGQGQGDRFNNCFRLPPADVPIQASAVALITTDKSALNAQRVALLRDIAPDAGEYSGPLYRDLLRLLGPILIFKNELDAQRGDVRSVALGLLAQSPDVVIFCGYGSNANALLGALNFAYKDVALDKRPRIVLTDGAKVKDLVVNDFREYLTFPAPDLASYRCDTPDGANLRALLADGPMSYEMYGYDSALLVGDAIEACRNKGISRQCILAELRKEQSFVGACLPYSFHNSENILSSYYVYSNCDQYTVCPELKPLHYVNEISAEELTRFRATRSAP
jgi:ABC-type branched-subunit amino acid transport system substrate-binding protein